MGRIEKSICYIKRAAVGWLLRERPAIQGQMTWRQQAPPCRPSIYAPKPGWLPRARSRLRLQAGLML